MLYSGIFRSLDQSVDPKGQLYKVLIFTGYNPNDLNEMIIGEDPQVNVGPYPVKRVRVGFSGVQFAYRNIPDTDSVVNLTMTDHPFTVEYSGDTDNVHKPYRCSTATVSFLQENLNTDFINSIGNGVMVMLLKWKNEVIQTTTTQGEVMLNTATGAELEIANYVYNDPITHRQNRYFYGFLPWAYDWFCYDVEWVGFATPEMLNVEYDHITDRFSLNCQDALSTLQYINFERTDQLETIQDTLIKMLNKLGTYEDVYITTSVHFNSVTNAFYTIPLEGSAMKHIVHQQDNFINEDDDPDKYLDVLEKMLDYLSLTAIPYKNSLWIVSNEGLAMGHTTYSHFTLGLSERPWVIPAEIPSTFSYSYMGDVDITDTTVLNGDSFCGGTDLSSNIIYNKVKVVCDEMRPEPLLPDLNDNENYEPETTAMDQPVALNLWDHYQTNPLTPGESEDNYQYFEMYLNRVATGVDDIRFFRYEYDSNTPHWNKPQLDVTDNDLFITHAVRYAGQDTTKTPLMDWVSGIQTPPTNPNTGAGAGYPGVMACMVDRASSSVGNRTDKPLSMSFSRSIFMATPANGTWVRSRTTATSDPYNWDDKTENWMPVVYLKSKPFLANGKQYINFCGDFTFYGDGNTPGSWIPCNFGKDYTSGGPGSTTWAHLRAFNPDYNYLWMKIKCGNYYLISNGRGSYSWTTTESYVKMWCDNAGKSLNDDYRHTAFPLETTIRNIEGITVNFSSIVPEGQAKPMQLEIWIDRPIGPGTYGGMSCTMDDFEVNIFSKEYVESRKRRNPDRDNTEYSNPILEGAIEERPEVNLNHSSCDTAGLSYSETARKEVFSLRPGATTTRYTTNPQVFNEGAGHYGLPEQVKIESLRNQGITPTVVMKTQVFNNLITPISRVFWSWLGAKPFIVDSMSIDYEYEQCDANLVEMKQPSSESISIERVNSTRNLYRTRDIIFNGHIARKNTSILQPVIPINTSVNNPANTNTPVVLSTDNDMAGNSSLNIDWTTGQARLSTSPISGVSASNNNGQVVITI